MSGAVKRRLSCSDYTGCRAKECKECNHCLDMKKYGGEGKRKQKYKKRKCTGLLHENGKFANLDDE